MKSVQRRRVKARLAPALTFKLNLLIECVQKFESQQIRCVNRNKMLFYLMYSVYITNGVFLFLNSLQPIPCRLESNSSVHEFWVYSHSYFLGGHFLYNQQQPTAGEGKVAKYWKKRNI